MKKYLILFVPFFIACNSEEKAFDATGTFEAREVIVSAEQTGKLIDYAVDEGQMLEANARVAEIDSAQLVLKKAQLEAQIKAVLSRQPDVQTQLAALQEQIKTANFELNRLENLVKGGAATQKQLDDANAQIDVLEKQLAAQRSALQTTTSSIQSEVAPLSLQIEQVNDLLNKCHVVNPINGTVLTSYVEAGEIAVAGKPLYRIADLSHMELRAYVTGDQLATLSIGQKVTVSTDNGSGGFNQQEGSIIWISEEAEFTPKTIQTKDERANLVYAIRISVPNDGKLKIGMYGEVSW